MRGWRIRCSFLGELQLSPKNKGLIVGLRRKSSLRPSRPPSRPRYSLTMPGGALLYHQAERNDADTWGEEARLRTALGPAMEYYAMYNDRPELKDNSGGMAGLSANDNRARSSGPAAWNDPLKAETIRFEEKYVKPVPAGSNPFAIIETKSGYTAEVRDQLKREREIAQAGGAANTANVAAAARAAAAPPPPTVQPGGGGIVPGGGFSRGVDLNAPRRMGEESAYDKLVKESNTGGGPGGGGMGGGMGGMFANIVQQAQDRPAHRAEVQERAHEAWGTLRAGVAASQRFAQAAGEVADAQAALEAADAAEIAALNELLGRSEGSALRSLMHLPRSNERRPAGWSEPPPPGSQLASKSVQSRTASLYANPNVHGVLPPPPPPHQPMRPSTISSSVPPEGLSPEKAMTEAAQQRALQVLYKPKVAQPAPPPAPPPPTTDEKRKNGKYKVPSKPRLGPGTMLATAAGFQAEDDRGEKIERVEKYQHKLGTAAEWQPKASASGTPPPPRTGPRGMRKPEVGPSRDVAGWAVTRNG